MKFSTRIDTELSADELFGRVTDFGHLERMLIRRDVSIARIDPAQEPGTGIGWNLSFHWRGKVRRMRLQVTRFDRPERLSILGTSEALETSIDFTVVALSRARSRLIFETDLRPRNMRARLMLQTAKLGKSQLDRRFERRVAEFIEELRQVA